MNRKISASDFRRFFLKISFSTIEHPNNCWEWIGAKARANYGNFYWNKKNIPAHRFSYLAFNGEIPDGLFVLHRCDNSICVNPYHLFIGTQKENILDASRKGRLMRGERHSQSKLAEKDIVEIRKKYKSGLGDTTTLAVEFGVSSSQIHNIVTGKKWAHIKYIHKATP